MSNDRIHNAQLRSRIVSPEQAAALIQHGETVAMSGFTGSGYPKAVPLALKKAKPGTPEFRAALTDATETRGRTVVSHGVLTYAKDNHWGFTTETGVILKVVNGDWKVE